MNAWGIVAVLAAAAVALLVLSVWFPWIRRFLKWTALIIAEIFYVVFFWWWFATIRKARHKSYPKAWPFRK